MKHLKKIPFFCLLLLSCIFFTVCALRGSKDVYRTYIEEENPKTTPLLTAVFEGIHDGILPWDAFLPSEQDSHLAELSPSDIPQQTNSANTDSMASSEELTDSVDVITSAPTNDSSAQYEEHTPIPTVPATATPTPTPIPLGPDGLPIVEYVTVDASYFDDAVFIGDSRIVGMNDYSGLTNATFFAKTGLTVYNLLDDEFLKDPDTGKDVSVSYMMQHHTYGKIYLMVGINELGTGGTESFAEAYKDVLKKFRKWQPDAVIYVQSIMGVSPKKDKTDPVFNNTNIRDKNYAISKLTDGIHIFYLNIQEIYEYKNHNLLQDLTFDDVHLYAQHYDKWVKYLKTHAVVKGEEK